MVVRKLLENLKSFVKICGFIMRSQHHTPYIGLVEKRTMTIMKMVRCVLKEKKLPHDFRGNVIRTSYYVLNMSRNNKVDVASTTI